MRLIDADHLKKWIIDRSLKYQLKTADILDQIDRELTFLEDRKQGEWIPIGERLPEELKDVLVCTKRGYVTCGYYTDDLYDAWCVNQDFFLGLGDVVAWMPVPKPYKAGESE